MVQYLPLSPENNSIGYKLYNCWKSHRILEKPVSSNWMCKFICSVHSHWLMPLWQLCSLSLVVTTALFFFFLLIQTIKHCKLSQILHLKHNPSKTKTTQLTISFHKPLPLQQPYNLLNTGWHLSTSCPDSLVSGWWEGCCNLNFAVTKPATTKHWGRPSSCGSSGNLIYLRRSGRVEKHQG